MRAVTIAAAGAAVIGSVSAASHVENMHAKLHNKVARDTWLDWNSTSVDPVDGDKTSTTTGWGTKPVDPASSSSTTGWGTRPVDGATTSTTTTTKKWSAPSTSTTPAAAVTTTSEEHSWEDWSSSSTTTTTTKKVDAATTSTVEDPWADWESSSTTTTTTKKPVDPATTSTAADHTWADWEESTSTTSKKVNPATSSSDPDHTWVDWVEPTTTITMKSTVTNTKYVEPVTSADPTWEDWESTAAAVSSKPVAPVTSVVTSTIVPGWSSAGWFGPSWAVEPGSCAVSIITSYGLPTWRPVADASTTTTETWGDWVSTTTTPVAAASTTTSSETWGDWTTSSSVAPVTVTSVSSSTWDDWVSTTSAAAATTTTAPGGGWGVPSSSAAIATTTAGSGGWPKSGGGSGGGYPGITPNGDSWGLTYSPYTAQGGCKDAGTVAKDLAIIAAKGFSTVRVYSTDCGTLENIGKSARDNGLKLILGVWVSSTGIGAAKGQVDDIVKWGQWDLVELIVVGNEVIFNNIASASDLAGFISSSTWAFKAAGYTGPVTTTEPLSVWEDKGNAAALGGVIDVVGANLYAFFNAQISADKAGQFIQAQINILNGLFSGKPIYVLESGWPHGGNANGAAVPSPENQAIALKGIQAAVGAQVVFLSYEDEPWKEPGQFGVEQFWGCASVF